MRIGCVAFVGRDNDPLALRVFTQDGIAIDALDIIDDSPSSSQLIRYHFLTYCSLDMVDERHKQPGQTWSAPPKKSMYLGYLCPQEEFHMYAYVTNTYTKIIVALEEAESSPPELQTFCEQAHHLFVNQLQNPFRKVHPGWRVTSPRFSEELDKLVTIFNRKSVQS
mmetsp:Transcript_28786/g.64329  ORF Transcript_28786/g.64329 Transcript_28786/m.64329 type:complete len:166 (+) Transcript_28786:166-663(+)